MIPNIFPEKRGRIEKIFFVVMIFVLASIILIGIYSAEGENQDNAQPNEGGSDNADDSSSQPVDNVDSEPPTTNMISENPIDDSQHQENGEPAQDFPSDSSEIVQNETPESPQEDSNFSEDKGDNENFPEEEIHENPPEISVKINNPEKITRGESFEITAEITNIGGKAKSVAGKWVLPNGFEIVSESETKDCGNMDSNTTCSLRISVSPSLFTELGKNEIKLKVSYK